MAEFAVVSIPTTIRNMTVGSGYGLTGGTCSVELFVRDKGGIANIHRLDELVGKVASLFPVSRDGVFVSVPTLIFSGSDGYGFNVASLNAAIHTI